MDVVYIIGPYSKWGDNELRFSLRSLEQWMPDLGNIYLVGHCPTFVRNVTHVRVTDPFKNPLANLVYKVRVALGINGLEDFVLMNDDMWLLDTWQPNWVFHKGQLSTAIEQRGAKGDNYYYRALKDCRTSFIEFTGKEPLNFELHCPLFIDRRFALRALDLFFYGADSPGVFRSYYGNLLPDYLRTGEMVDSKISRHWIIPQGKLLFLSADDFAIQGRVARSWFSKTYPDRSRYEDRNWKF